MFTVAPKITKEIINMKFGKGVKEIYSFCSRNAEGRTGQRGKK